ncbi:MaoC family dehydratase [Natrialbaceae archaeon A-CW1-1]
MSTASPGDRTQTSQHVTTEHIETFAALTGDENPLHLDPEYAAAGLFEEPIAHGMIAAGIISSALADLPGDIIYLSQELSFEAPVYPGQTVIATAEVLEALGNDRYRVETTATVEDEVVVSGEATVLSLVRDDA